MGVQKYTSFNLVHIKMIPQSKSKSILFITDTQKDTKKTLLPSTQKSVP